MPQYFNSSVIAAAAAAVGGYEVIALDLQKEEAWVGVIRELWGGGCPPRLARVELQPNRTLLYRRSEN